MYFELKYENRMVKPFEIVLRRGTRDEGEWKR
jgi:hypothetical protein